MVRKNDERGAPNNYFSGYITPASVNIQKKKKKSQKNTGKPDKNEIR